MDKIKLNILGLSYSQTHSGAYALVLAEDNGKRRLPIIIGGTEAQSIAIQLEGLVTPRPLTHDLFVSLASSFMIMITEVYITKLEDGIFYSELVCDDGKQQVRIDTRTSDAVALALRFRCPIFTNEKVMDKAGIAVELETDQVEGLLNEQAPSEEESNEYQRYDMEELEQMLEEAISQENYEEASLLRDEINKRKDQI